MDYPQELTLEQLFKKYYKRLAYFAFQLVSDKENAEDIVQEAFIKYWNQKSTIGSGEFSVRSYLYQSVKNACFNVLRHHQVAERYTLQTQISEADEETIERYIIRAEVLAELYTAIESLPECCQKISRMSFLEEKNNQEIAQNLGISINTVKTQKQRGLQLLRLRLKPDLYSVLFLTIFSNS